MHDTVYGTWYTPKPLFYVLVQENDIDGNEINPRPPYRIWDKG